MDFDLNLDALTNETDVRENICAPLLCALGYRIGTVNNIITEQSLRYGKQSLGRKKATDPVLRGKADYTLMVEERYRWILEAKSTSESITLEAREQACTYAMHPEVKAIYYVLTNGREIEIHRTIDGPSAPPVFATSYSDLRTNFQTIINLLGPDSIKQAFPNLVLDTGKPLAPGLRSTAKIINGHVTYTSITPNLPGLVGLKHSIWDGSIERNGEKILAYFKVSGGSKQLDDFNRALGLETLEIYSTAAELSLDPSKPTIFEAPLDWECPPGSVLQLPPFVQKINFSGMFVSSFTRAEGSLSGKTFKGSVRLTLKTSKGPIPMNAEFGGEFEVTIG